MKKIILIATGGTIAGKNVVGGYEAGVLDVKDLTRDLGLEKLAEVSYKQLFNVGSHDITDELLLDLAHATREMLEKCDGIVILHGTDTMEESAYFLNLVIKTSKPIIFTGAMRTSQSLISDGARNITDAVRVALCEQSHGQGVVIVMNGEIHSAREVTKINTSALNAFSSPNSGKIGVVSEFGVKFYMKSLRIHTENSEFTLNNIHNLARVGIVYHHQNAQISILQGDFAGIIVAGCGNGNMSRDFLRYLKKLSDSGVIIARSSRVGSGEICGGEINDAEFGFIACDNLNPQKARILLATTLNFTQNKTEIQRIFDEY